LSLIDGAEEPRKKRRSRWAAEEEKVTIPGMPTALPTNMTEEQLEMFLRKWMFDAQEIEMCQVDTDRRIY